MAKHVVYTVKQKKAPTAYNKCVGNEMALAKSKHKKKMNKAQIQTLFKKAAGKCKGKKK